MRPTFLLWLAVHRTAALGSAGAVFLLLTSGARMLPSRYVATTTVLTRAPLASSRVPPRVKATPGDAPHVWKLEAAGASKEAALLALTSALRALESPDASLPSSNAPYMTARLEEKKRLLAQKAGTWEEAQRRISALDAVILALKVRRKALQEGSPSRTDLNARNLESLKALYVGLSMALPAGDPRLQAVAVKLRELETSGDAGATDTEQRLTLFRGQLQALRDRYSPSHPEVARKAAEVEALEKRYREEQSLMSSIPSVLEEVARRETEAWEAATAAIQKERGRWSAEIQRVRSLEREVATLQAKLEEHNEQRAAGDAPVLVSKPEVWAVSQAPGFWALGALAAAFVVGVAILLKPARRRRVVWTSRDFCDGMAADAVFCAPQFSTPGLWAVSALKIALALVPWMAAVPLIL